MLKGDGVDRWALWGLGLREPVDVLFAVLGCFIQMFKKKDPKKIQGEGSCCVGGSVSPLPSSSPRDSHMYKKGV